MAPNTFTADAFPRGDPGHPAASPGRRLGAAQGRGREDRLRELLPPGLLDADDRAPRAGLQQERAVPDPGEAGGPGPRSPDLLPPDLADWKPRGQDPRA